MFAGLDWAQDEHAVCVVDTEGQVVDRFMVKHDRKGLEGLLRRLSELSETPIPVAIERPNGLIVDVLVDAGQPVVPIHPNVVKATRARYSAARGKSDPGDAYILADMLRTDGHRFNELKPMSDEIRALRARVRARDDLVAAKVRIANQLRAHLETFWPGALAIFADFTSAIGMAFLRRYPTPQSAARLGPKRLENFLRDQGYSGGRSPEVLLERLRSAPRSLAAQTETIAGGEIVQGLGAVLSTLIAQIKQLSATIERAVATLELGRVVMSLPRAGRVNAAQIVAEIVDPHRWGSFNHLAAQAGVVPVTYASGKRRGVGYRWACNRRLRKALTTWADNTRHASEWAKGVYQRSRARGHGHSHAIRILSRAWLRVLWRCLLEGVAYDEERHAGARTQPA